MNGFAGGLAQGLSGLPQVIGFNEELGRKKALGEEVSQGMDGGGFDGKKALALAAALARGGELQGAMGMLTAAAQLDRQTKLDMRQANEDAWATEQRGRTRKEWEIKDRDLENENQFNTSIEAFTATHQGDKRKIAADLRALDFGDGGKLYRKYLSEQEIVDKHDIALMAREGVRMNAILLSNPPGDGRTKEVVMQAYSMWPDGKKAKDAVYNPKTRKWHMINDAGEKWAATKEEISQTIQANFNSKEMMETYQATQERLAKEKHDLAKIDRITARMGQRGGLTAYQQMMSGSKDASLENDTMKGILSLSDKNNDVAEIAMVLAGATSGPPAMRALTSVKEAQGIWSAATTQAKQEAEEQDSWYGFSEAKKGEGRAAYEARRTQEIVQKKMAEKFKNQQVGISGAAGEAEIGAAVDAVKAERGGGQANSKGQTRASHAQAGLPGNTRNQTRTLTNPERASMWRENAARGLSNTLRKVDEKLGEGPGNPQRISWR